MDTKIKSAVIQTIVSIILLFAAVFLSAYFFKKDLMDFAAATVNTTGIQGLAAGIFISDILPAFIPVDFFLFLAIAAGLNDFDVIAVCFVSSISGGSFSYASAKYIFPLVPFIKNFLKLYEDKVTDWLQSYGSQAVIVSALTPIPYSWMAYTAGSFNMKYRDFFLASLFRLLRFGAYYYFIKFGWMSYGSV